MRHRDIRTCGLRYGTPLPFPHESLGGTAQQASKSKTRQRISLRYAIGCRKNHPSALRSGHDSLSW
eukprot:2199427-Amphidinium_carterae.1